MTYRFLSILTVGFFMIMYSQAQPNPEITRFIDGMIASSKASSVFAHRVMWDTVRAHMVSRAASAKSISELQPALMILLEALNDKQARVTDIASGQTIATLANHETVADKTEFEFSILDGDVNYLRIGTIADNADIQKEAEKIRTALDSLGRDESAKWVLDLRGCNGRNASAIFAGIAPLLGEGQVCAEVDGKYRVRKLYEIHNGNFYDDKLQVAKFPYTNELHHQTIAVLIDENTGRAGEMVAISLKGRKNARFFGKPTMGCSAGVMTVDIPKGITLTLSHCFYQDRKGNPYTTSVRPDVITAEQESAIEQAMQWLHSQESIASTSIR